MYNVTSPKLTETLLKVILLTSELEKYIICTGF